MYISVVIPVLNEEENIKVIYSKLKEILDRINRSYEIIFVDDGSNDNTFEILAKLAKDEKRLKVIKLCRNFGQTAALAAGFDIASGEIIIPMDGDLQNDPVDIPKLLEKIEEGYDVVSGWRKKRKDSLFTRKIPSILANYLISLFTGVKLHDYGCTLKAYKSQIVKNIRLYGEMHRFLPAHAALTGAKVTEVEVLHHPRIYGKSKYGISRIIKVILDLFTLKFLGTFSTKPIHLFGSIGLILLFFGFISGSILIINKLFFGAYMIQSPLLLLTVMLILLGVQFILIGLLAEIVIRTYHEAQNKPTYLVKERIN
jgi:glycosyltransferase involved in cell wall biosynthesis